MPAKMKVMIRGHRAAERGKLVVAEARRQSDTDQERDGDRQHHHVVHVERKYASAKLQGVDAAQHKARLE